MSQIETKSDWSELVSFILGLLLMVVGIFFLAVTMFWVCRLKDPQPIGLYLTEGLLLLGVGWLVFKKAMFFFEQEKDEQGAKKGSV